MLKFKDHIYDIYLVYLYRLEMCAVTFFTLQNICEELENRKIKQSSQILSKFNVESIISLIDSPFDDLFEKTFEESAKRITFSEYQNIIDFPSEKIKKYVLLFFYNDNLLYIGNSNLNFKIKIL